MRILKTFFSEIITQSNTAFRAGTLLIIFNGLNTRSSFIDFSLAPVGVPLEMINFKIDQNKQKFTENSGEKV